MMSASRPFSATYFLRTPAPIFPAQTRRHYHASCGLLDPAADVTAAAGRAQRRSELVGLLGHSGAGGGPLALLKVCGWTDDGL